MLRTPGYVVNQRVCVPFFYALGRLVKRIDLYQGTVSSSIGATSNATNQCAGNSSNPETATWSYDPTNAKGQVYQVNGKEGYRETYTYDNYSRVTQLVKRIAGVDYAVTTDYSQQRGRIYFSCGNKNQK